MVGTGWLLAAASVNKAKSLFARSVDGRGRTGAEPCLSATSRAVYGRVIEAKRGEEKKEERSRTRASKVALCSANDGGCTGRVGTEDIERVKVHSFIPPVDGRKRIIALDGGALDGKWEHTEDNRNLD